MLLLLSLSLAYFHRLPQIHLLSLPLFFLFSCTVLSPNMKSIDQKIICCSFYRPTLTPPCFKFLHPILFLLSSITLVTAQSVPPGSGPQYPQYTGRLSPSMAIIIVVVIAALFFMGFFSVYIRNCGGTGGPSIRPSLSLRSRRAVAVSRGLEPSLIETFPMFLYSEVMALKIGKGALECAVCLNEFEEDETLRLIPKCDHVFHPDCIDAWFESHVTCPVCRADLLPPPGGESSHFHPPVQQLNDESNCTEQATQENVDVSIRIGDDRSEAVNPSPNNVGGSQLPPSPPQKEAVLRNSSFNQNRPPRSRPVVRTTRLFVKFRSHSTGHSLVQHGENMERFTLRLPEEVRKEMMCRAALKSSGSLAALPRESSRRGCRTREGSSRGRSYGMFERLEVRSDRWFFSTAPLSFSRA